MKTINPRAPGAPLPKPATGPLVHPVKCYLSEGEHACLCAVAEQLGCTPDATAGALLSGALKRHHEARHTPAPKVPAGQLALFPLFPARSQGAASHD